MGVCSCVLGRPGGCYACNPQPYPYQPLAPIPTIVYWVSCPTCGGSGVIPQNNGPYQPGVVYTTTTDSSTGDDDKPQNT